MKIIKNKKKEFGVHKFACQNCSSEFEADEYDISKTEEVGEWKFFYGFRKTPVYSLGTQCPVCRKNTWSHIPTGEEPYWSGHAI